jgi:hypothetical protein
MKYKLIIGILVFLVSVLMLMSNVMASGWPPNWVNQARLSILDSNPSRDPENSGFGPIHVVVWEEWNGNNWDIHMKYNLVDGAPLSWSPPIAVATDDDVDEINPAVTVTNINPDGNTEIHVVYQRENLDFPNTYDIIHKFTPDFGRNWPGVQTLDMNEPQNAIDPAIVYTEDVSNPDVRWYGMLVQIVWSEVNPATGRYDIKYNAYYLDPTVRPPNRGYAFPFPGGSTTIRPAPAGSNCMVPEIASVDERFTGGIFDYYFAIVWQEGVIGLWTVMYVDGLTIITPGPPVIFLSGAGAISTGPNCYDPDIAATQDYQEEETYYFHVDFVTLVVAGIMQIDTCYYIGNTPTPGAASFIPTAPAQGPGPAPFVLDRPTIASKLIQVGPTIFETWMAWEDSTNPAANNPDIWFSVGTCQAGGAFGYTWVAARVGYNPPLEEGSIEHNPELWNRNDAVRMFPLLTHLVFDQDVGGGIPEVIYIDP